MNENDLANAFLSGRISRAELLRRAALGGIALSGIAEALTSTGSARAAGR